MIPRSAVEYGALVVLLAVWAYLLCVDLAPRRRRGTWCPALVRMTWILRIGAGAVLVLTDVYIRVAEHTLLACAAVPVSIAVLLYLRWLFLRSTAPDPSSLRMRHRPSPVLADRLP